MPRYLSSPDGGGGGGSCYAHSFQGVSVTVGAKGLCAVTEGAWENGAGRAPDSQSIPNSFFAHVLG